MIGTWVFWKVAWERLVDSGSYFNKVRGVLWKLSCERGRWMVGHISMKSRGFYETISKRGLWMAGWFPWSPGSLLQNSQISSRRSLLFARDLTVAVFLADVDAVPSHERDQVSVLKRFLFLISCWIPSFMVFLCRHCNFIAELTKIIKYILTLIKFFGETLNNACIQRSKLCKKLLSWLMVSILVSCVNSH